MVSAVPLVNESLAHSLFRFLSVCRRYVSQFDDKVGHTNQLLSQFTAEKINLLRAGLGLVGIVKNCDLGFEDAALVSYFNTSVTVFHYTDLTAGN